MSAPLAGLVEPGSGLFQRLHTVQTGQEHLQQYRTRRQQHVLPVTEIPGQVSAAVQEAMAQQQWAEVVTLAQRYPEHFTCRDVENLWALANAHEAQRRPDDSLAVYTRILSMCPEGSVRLGTLHKAMGRVPPLAMEALVRQAQEGLGDPGVRSQIADLQYQFDVQRLLAMDPEQAFTQARHVEPPLHAEIEQRRDSSTAMRLAWGYFQHGDMLRAGAWFSQILTWEPQREEAAYGLALVKSRQGDWRGLQQLVAQWQDISPRVQRLATDARQHQRGFTEAHLWRLFQQRRYAEVEHEIGRLQRQDPTWHPPPSLRHLLEQERAQHTVRHAVQQRQWAQILRLAQQYPQQFTCQQIEHLWALAAAYQAQQRGAQSLAIYERILTTCPDQQAKLGTLFKALGQVPSPAMETLLRRAANTMTAPAVRAQLAEIQYQFTRQRFLDAVAAQDHAQALRLSTALQPHLERHRDSNTATLLGWSAVHQGDLAAGLTWFAQALSWTPGHDEAAYGIALVHRQQGDLASAERLARQWLDTAPRWRRFLGEFLLARAGESRQQGQYIGSLQLLEAGESYEIPQPAARLMAAWNALDLRQLPAAVAGFTAVLEQDPASKDAAYGLVLASRQHGDLARAEAVARQWEATSAPMRDALGAILLERAGVSHRQQQYAESQRFLEASAPYQPLTRAGEMLHGWNAYHLGQYEVAAASFVALHQALPDEESAQGVWRSYVQAQFWAPLGALAQRQPGPLTTLWRQHWSQRHADRSLWRAAEHIAPGTLASLRGLDSPLVSLGGLVRDKSGTSGLSALQLQLAPLATTTLSYDTVHTFGLRVGRLRLDSGALGPHAPIGHLPDTPMPYRVAPTTALDNSVEAHVRYSQEGWLTPYAELGLTPTGGKVPSFPIWRLGLLQQTEAGHWRLEGFSQPVRESLLSYTGLADPYSGTVWGRVLRTGIGLSTYRSLGERWGMAGQLSASWLRGQRVAENWQVGAQVSVGYNVAPPGFTYLTVGPQLGLEHYAKNLSHFTLGHGGYFSPEYQGQIGLAAHFLTTEGRWFLAKGSLSLGWQSHRDSRSPVFPLMPDGRTFAAQTESGIVFASEVQALARLSAHWQLGVGIALRQTATFDDKAFSLFVQYGLQARRAVLSSDFPSHVFQTAY